MSSRGDSGRGEEGEVSSRLRGDPDGPPRNGSEENLGDGVSCRVDGHCVDVCVGTSQ